MPSVAIIGAGLTGLAAAYHLYEEDAAAFSVFEAGAQAGGVVHSECTNGYLVEHGPNTLQSIPPILEDILTALDLEGRIVEPPPTAKKRYVVRGGQPLPVPDSLKSLLTTDLLSWPAKVRLLREPFASSIPGKAEESVADFVSRRLGQEVLDYAVNPFVGGIYAGDPQHLSLRYAFPRLYELEEEHGSLLKGALFSKHQSTTRRRLFSFDEGLQTLPLALAHKLEGRIHLQTRVTAIEKRKGRWVLTLRHQEKVSTRRFDAVIYAAPLHELANIGLSAPLDLAPLLEVLYPPLSVLALGFRRQDVAHPLDGFGMLVPAAEDAFNILGTLFSSTLFPNRAPEDHVLLTSFVGGMRHPDLGLASTDTLVAIARQDLATLLGVRGEPTFVKRVAWQKAIPQYHLGYGQVHRCLDELEAARPGLFWAGNYRGGVSAGDAMASGQQAARRAAASLGAP